MTTLTIEPGDYVRDPLDEGALRQVDRVEGTCVYMTDGGFMARDEITEVLLSSEIDR